MKLSVVLLAVAGVVAALAAAVLMGTLSARRSGEWASAKTTLMVAAQDLPALSVVTEAVVSQQEIMRSQLPAGGLTSPAQVVGQLLIVPMTKGQAFTSACFAGKSPGQQLLKALPPGKRAMSVSLAHYSALSGLLYPGAVVDVLSTYKSGSDSEVVSKTLLRGVQVLAIEDETVGAEKAEKGETGSRGSRAGSGGRQVTLMVDSRQASALQVAMERGNVSLVLRNPQEVSSEPQVAQAPTEDGNGVRRRSTWDIQVLRGTEASEVSVPWPSQETPGGEADSSAVVPGTSGGS